MKYLKEEKTTQKNPLLIPVILLSIAVVILMGLLLIFVFGNKDEVQPMQNQVVPSNRTHMVETEDGDVVDEDFLETPYCKLYYPAQWKDSMVGTVIETGTGSKVVFTGKAADKEAEVFAIYFGESTEDAFPVGIMKTEAGEEIMVYAELFDFEYDDTWNQEEIDTICAMQESINHVIAKIEEQIQPADK